MKDLLLVMMGGGLGSVMRYLLGKWLNPLLAHFPLGTWLANIVACVILGILGGVLARKMLDVPEMRLFVLTGFCGGLSTFSSFESELFIMAKSGQFLPLGVYLLSSLVTGFVAVWLGHTWAR